MNYVSHIWQSGKRPPEPHHYKNQKNGLAQKPDETPSGTVHETRYGTLPPAQEYDRSNARYDEHIGIFGQHEERPAHA